MPELWLGKFGELRSMSTAGGGTALSTTAAFVQFPAVATAGNRRQGQLFLTPRNFSTAVVAQVLFNPWLTILKTADGMTTLPTDYSISAQDGSTDTDVTLSSLDTIANGDWALVGSHSLFGGAFVDVDGTNGTASRTLTVAYWDERAGGWTDYSLTYSTAWTTAFDADTIITWTLGTGWVKKTFRSLYPDLPRTYYSDTPMYWTRWSVNGALDSSTTLDALCAVNRSSAYGEVVSGDTVGAEVVWGFGGLGCIQAKVNAGTGNLIANIATIKDAEF